MCFLKKKKKKNAKVSFGGLKKQVQAIRFGQKSPPYQVVFLPKNLLF